MKIDYNKKNENLIASLHGDIDHHVAEDIKNSIEKHLISSRSKNLIFDFKDVTFMDSSGIGLIIGRYKLLEKQGGKVAIICICENVKKLFTMSGLSKIIKSYDSLDDCLKNL